MSFAEIVECVMQLSLGEKVQLQSLVAEDLVENIPGLSPEWFKPGMVAQTGSMVTTDEAGMRLIYEIAGIPLPN